MTFRAELYESFKKVSGPASILLGLLLALAAFYFLPSSTIFTKHIVAGLVVIVLVNWTLFDAAYRLFTRAKSPISTVLRVLRPAPIHEGKCALLLLEPSQVLGQESFVSIFQICDGFEILIGIGTVHIIQEDGKVQILAQTIDEATHKSSWDGILTNDSNSLKQLRIKPSIPSNLVSIIR